MSTPIPKKDLDNLREQLNNMPKDKDRIRLITAAADSFQFTTAQMKQLIEVQHYGDAKNQTAILLHPKLLDPQNFEKLIIPCFKFQEDIQEIKTALNL